MKLTKLGPNQTEIEIAGGARVLYSYNTPVAAFVPGRGLCRTEKRWSSTTSKHINQWLDGATAEEKPQTFFDTLTGGCL